MTTNAVKDAKKIFPASNIKNISAASLYIRKYKIVVFVPVKNVKRLTFRMARAGAGVIGNYRVCSFRVKGTGTFKGGKGSNPRIGRKGRFETTEEIRLEMICPKKDVDRVIDTVYKYHPYDEPACDIYEIMVREKKPSGKTAVAKAVIVELKKKITLNDVLGKINRLIDVSVMPVKIKNIKIGRAVVDYSGNEFFPARSNVKTMYIKRNKNITNVEIL